MGWTKNKSSIKLKSLKSYLHNDIIKVGKNSKNGLKNSLCLTIIKQIIFKLFTIEHPYSYINKIINPT